MLRARVLEDHKKEKTEFLLKNKIHHLYAGPFPSYQGTPFYIRHLLRALGDAGVGVSLACYGVSGYVSVEKMYGVMRSYAWGQNLRSGPSFSKICFDASMLFKNIGAVWREKPSVLHAHGYEALCVAWMLKKMYGIPIVYHAHHVMGYELAGYFSSSILRKAMQHLGDGMDTFLPRCADALVVFDDDHKIFYRMAGIEEKKIHVIPAGIDPQEITSPETYLLDKLSVLLNHKKKWFLYAGNPDHYQNLDLLWRAFGLVVMKNPDAGLLIATPYPPHDFYRMCEKQLWKKNVHVYHCKTLEELKALHAYADVGVCPRSTWTGMPMKVLNYCAAGLPVVACRSACKHMLTSHEGVLTHAEPHSFAEGMLKMLGHERKKRVVLPDKFCVQNHVDRFLHVYQTVLHGNTGFNFSISA
jgi:glycosyltransferase involved in cell wall biosynthesis